MQFFKTQPTQTKPDLNPPKPNVENPFSTLETQFTTLETQFTTLKTQFQNTIQFLGTQSKRVFHLGFPHFAPPPPAPNFARAYPLDRALPVSVSTPAVSVEERLSGVPVYTLSNASEEFVLLSSVRTGKSLGLFCFKREDAEALLQQMQTMDPSMRHGSKVVAVALDKVYQLKVNGVAFRFIPELCQVQNALQEKKKLGDRGEVFAGVPVFQSRSLILTSQNKRYRPVFFRKEDLDNSLMRASSQQKHLNPAFRKGDIKVCAFEEIINGMQESSSSNWDDVVFIPPGFDVSTNPNE